MPEKIVVIQGPTATGKTALSVALAKELCGEVVSADSMQLYIGMDIGTAKVKPSETEGVPHHMIDVASPFEAYSVARYVEEAGACIEDILARGKLPILCGGTNLYIDSLISGRDFAANTEDGELRAELFAQYEKVGGEAMLSLLRSFDPERAEKLHPSDSRRIVRAIEIYRLTGETATEHDRKTRLLPPRYEAHRIALDYEDRAQLYSRIDSRVDAMIAEGLFDEVKKLLDSGLNSSHTAMQAIGYKEPTLFFEGRLGYDDCVETIKRESRRYAKRQLTWLRRDSTLFWIHHGHKPNLTEARLLSTEYLRSCGL